MESLESQTTGRTDERDDHADGGYLDIDDDSILADFKMPDLGVRDDTFLDCSFIDLLDKLLTAILSYSLLQI